jgi:RimJ/RimL family protein N-acetyltransferase
MPEFQTLNLTIRACKPDDAIEFIALELDPHVMRFLTGGHCDDQTPRELEGTFLQPRGEELHVFTIRRTQTNSFVGWICLWPEDDHVAELGYRLSHAEWGHGLGTEAASALVDWGFRSANYQKIIASTMAANAASRRILEKLGFVLCRTVEVDWAKHVPGGELGEVHYELTQSNWAGPPDSRPQEMGIRP